MRLTTIFWIGDSTVHHNRIDTYPQTGMGQVFDLFLKPGILVRDYAENGRSSKSFLEEGLFEEVKADMREGDYLFIQFGHNDEKPAKELYTDPFGTFQEYLSLYIREAQNAGAFPVLLTPISRRKFDHKGQFVDGSHGAYPAAMMELAKRLPVPCIDLTGATARLLGETGEINSFRWFMNLKAGESGNPMYAEGQEDNTHLTYEGAVIMAGVAAEGLAGLSEPYSGLLQDSWGMWKLLVHKIAL